MFNHVHVCVRLCVFVYVHVLELVCLHIHTHTLAETPMTVMLIEMAVSTPEGETAEENEVYIEAHCCC